MQQNTPKQILTVLKNHGAVTPAVLADELPLTKADIRYHLRQLIWMNMVEEVALELNGKRGRPARLYRLPESSHPAAIRALVNAFLGWIQNSTSDLKPEYIRQAVRHLFQLEENISPSAAIRMARLMSAMNELGYEPHWEIRAAESRVNLHVCPYLDLVGDYPILCEMDRQAILSASRGEVVVDGLIADGSHKQCGFRVNLPT